MSAQERQITTICAGVANTEVPEICRTLLEGASFERARVHSDGVEIDVAQQDVQHRSQSAGGAGGEGNAQMTASRESEAHSERLVSTCTEHPCHRGPDDQRD